MTPAEQITQVRARLAGMQALCEATKLPGNLQSRNSLWYQMGDWCLSEAGSDEDAAFIAAVSPALMLRLVAHAENVLDRHKDWHLCMAAPWDNSSGRLCTEVEAVVEAWTP